MHILIVNGSPKGENSITLQTALYLKQCFGNQDFQILHAGRFIAKYEKDLSGALEAVAQAELIIFSYPVYTFLAPSQLHRLIRKMKEEGVSLRGKTVTQITTSKHFYDVTAHRCIEDNVREMGAGFLDGLSADMDDLLTEEGRRQAESWFRYVLFCLKNGFVKDPVEPAPAFAPVPVHPAGGRQNEKQGDIVIVADMGPEDASLAAMIGRFRNVIQRQTRLVNIREFPFQGGCMGCFQCAADGKCFYKDGFDTFLREQIQKADAVVIAFTICDHSMGPRFKTYDDRQFCNGHRTVTMGTPFGYLVSGALEREENLRTVIEARAEVGGNFLAGIATDEKDPDGAVDALAQKLCYAIDEKLVLPKNFYGVGGMKIFRDLIWLMRGMMRADHRFFKAHGQYDFPQKKRGTAAKMYLVGALLNNKKIMKKAGGKMNEGMLAPYKKVLAQAEARSK